MQTDQSVNREAAHEDRKLRDQSASAAMSVHHTSLQAPCYDQSVHIIRSITRIHTVQQIHKRC